MWEMLWCAPTSMQPRFALLITVQHSSAGWRKEILFICLTTMTQYFKTIDGILRHFMSQSQLVGGCGYMYCATQCTCKHFSVSGYTQIIALHVLTIFFESVPCCSGAQLHHFAAFHSYIPEENILLPKEMKVQAKALWRVLNLLLSSSSSMLRGLQVGPSATVFSSSHFSSQLQNKKKIKKKREK